MTRVVVVGATGAIGKAVIKYWTKNDPALSCYAVARYTVQEPTVEFIQVDYHDEETLAAAAKKIAAAGPVNYVVVATGMLHGDNVRPEKSWRHIVPDHFSQILYALAIPWVLAA